MVLSTSGAHLHLLEKERDFEGERGGEVRRRERESRQRQRERE